MEFTDIRLSYDTKSDPEIRVLKAVALQRAFHKVLLWQVVELQNRTFVTGAGVENKL